MTQSTVNLITGFLGTGKTTLLLSLMAQKPADESWAILVNEFGDVGIDGALLAQNEVQIKEVPGGCLCCVNGLPLQVGMTELLKQKPDRILIETTGLGHPSSLLAILKQAHFAQHLTVKNIITVLDATKLNDRRYTEHEIWQQQVAAADVLLINKQDLWQADTEQQLEHWLNTLSPQPKVVIAQQSNMPFEWLNHQRPATIEAAKQSTFSAAPKRPMLAPKQTWLRYQDQSSGFSSQGWIFSPDKQLNMMQLMHLLYQLPNPQQAIIRVKGVVHANDGWQAINLADGQLEVRACLAREDSRIEFISDQPLPWQDIEAKLLSLLS